jgi:hypothetical protein
MKVIRDIVLGFNGDEFELYLNSPLYESNFQFQSRFIGNYLRRQLKSLNFEPQGYKRLLIFLCQLECPPNKIGTFYSSDLFIYVPFEKNKYDNLPKDELTGFYIDLYLKGIQKAQQTHVFPEPFIREKLNEFKTDGYRNEWEFKSKTFKEIGIKATLFCKMTMEAFSLSLILSKKKEVVFSKEILNTLPDELCYHYQFKDIAYENNKIIVTGWYDAPPIFELDLSFKAELINNER